jgi:O-antigen ligase
MAALLLMLTGLFFSRALLSIGIVCFLVLALVQQPVPRLLKNFLRNPLLPAISFLFFIPFVSGLWSTNVYDWADVVRIKLPLLLLPLAFASSWQLSVKEWRVVFYFFLLLCFLGCCWSLWQYGQNAAQINDSYLKAKSLPMTMCGLAG